MKKTLTAILAALSLTLSSQALTYLGTGSGNDNDETAIEGIIDLALGGSVDITLLGKSDDASNPAGFVVFNITTPAILGNLTMLHGDGAKGETFNITYTGLANVAFLTIKYGQNYDVFSYEDGDFTVAYRNAISHISVWTTPDDPTTEVPDSSTSFALLGLGLLSLVGLKRFRR